MARECTEVHDGLDDASESACMIEVEGPALDGDGLSRSDLEALDAERPDRHRDADAEERRWDR